MSSRGNPGGFGEEKKMTHVDVDQVCTEKSGLRVEGAGAAAAAMTAAVLAAALLAGCSEETKVEAPQTLPAVAVEITRAGLGLPSVVTAAGSVVADRRVEAASRLTAYIRAVPYKEGDAVRAGDVVAVLDDRDVEENVRAASAKAAKARAAAKDAELDAEKISGLYKEGLVSNNDWRKALLNRTAAADTLREAEAGLAVAEHQRAYAKVAAPVSGRIASVLRREGDLALPGLAVVVIDSESDPKFEFQVPQRAADVVRPGERAEVVVDGVPGVLPGEVERVSGSADRVSRSFLARVKFDAKDAALVKPGMYGRVCVAAGEAATPWAPESAFARRGGLEGVFVIEDGRAAFRWLRTGRRMEGRVEVLAGLKGGEMLVDRPTSDVSDGRAVKVEKTEGVR